MTQYPPNMAYMSSSNSDPSRGTDRIRDTAKDCVAYVMQAIQKTETLGTTGQKSPTTTPSSTEVSKLFKTFSQIKGGSYWQLTKPGSTIGFYLKQLAGATLASDVTTEDGTGDRYVDEYALKNGLTPFPSPFALNSAKSVSNDFSGVGVVTVPGGNNGIIVIQPNSSSGTNKSSGNGQSSGTPAPPTPIH